MFSDRDPANKGKNSIEMLVAAVARVRVLGWRVQQADVTIVAEKPRVSSHRSLMQARLAPALGVDTDAISVKGKTNEGMGWIGRAEGIACIAVATIVSVDR
jgi:2-C-methyl-D-erythritol 2,4-cyclodiphosphate synthase